MITSYGKTFPFNQFMKVMEKAYESYDNIPLVTLVAISGRDPFKILISAMLSARTKDETTIVVTKRLFKVAGTAEKMSALSVDRIKKLIYPVGFYITKAPRVKAIAEKLIKEYDSIVPDSVEELLKFPGVGRKTANLVVGEAFKKPAICVDTHVHRISNRFGIITTKTPHKTELALAEILPKKHWILYNTYLVSHGQMICNPISPWCSKCQIRKFCKRKEVKKSR
jgi:endonuclease III